MNKTIIHIGLHKTATTYLQYNLFPQLTNTIYIHGYDFFNQWKNQQNKGNKNFLMSYEGFSGIAWNDQCKKGIINDFHWIDSFKNNITALKNFFPNAIIVVMFRRQGDLLGSMYKQYIQEGGVLPLKEFYGAGKVITPEDLSFKTRIDILKNYFDTVYCLNFEQYKKEGDEYFRKFCEDELCLNFDQDKNIGNTKSNRSISGKKIELLRKVNKFYQPLPRKFRTLVRYFRWSPRDIFQQRLAFWKTKDTEEFKRLKEQINKDFNADWAYFETHQWNYIE